MAKLSGQDWDGARAAFGNAGEYSNAKEQISAVWYAEGEVKLSAGDWDGARTAFDNAGEYRDAKEKISAVWYAEGEEKLALQDWNSARDAFGNAGEYSDAKERILAVWYAEGKAKQDAQDWDGARDAFGNSGEYSDAAIQISETTYQEANDLEKNGDAEGALKLFVGLGEYADAAERSAKLWYAAGLAKKEAKEWDAAVEAFTQAGSYSDAVTQIAVTRFLEGEIKKEEGDWDGAIAAYEAADEYGEAVRQIQECLYGKTISLCEKAKAGEVSAQQAVDAMLAISDAELFRQARDNLNNADLFRDLWTTAFTAGNTVYLGKFEQDNNPENGPEAIVWKVLYSQDGEALLLSEKVIDAMPFMTGAHRTVLGEYNPDEIWQRSDIYTWLTDRFADAITEQEDALLSANENGGTFFILDNREYKQYCSEEAFVEATAYALSKDEIHHDLLNYYKDETGNRTHGKSVMQWIRTGAVRADGYIYPDDLGMVAGVRPAVWISINRGPTDEWIENHFALPQEE